MRSAARALEEGRWDSPVTRALAAIWAKHAARGLVRPALVPSHIAVVCVGGATLGGSGKTRVAIACARALDEMGARVALIGHAYRSRRTMPCVVRVRVGTRDVDPWLLEEVGDEAIVCARAVASSRVQVVVGPSRQAAIDHAMLLEPDVLVLDGPLRISRAANVLSLLAVDAHRPWGSGRAVPAGDLRADRSSLLACADHVVPVDATPSAVRWRGSGHRASIASLRGLRVGLFTAIARPDRLVAALAALGIEPEIVVSAPDHGLPTGFTGWFRRKLSSVPNLDAWVATEKCALHLPGGPLRDGLGQHVELGILESEVVLSDVSFRAVQATLRRTTTHAFAH